jgi:lysophospholipase L1-like esterase
VPNTSVNVVYMGDSITFGQYVDPALRWSTLVDQRLRAEFGPAVNTWNSGVSSDTTRLGLERFPADLQAHEPDVVTIQFGLNDCNRWDTDRGHPRVSEEAFVANLREMIARARIFGARHIILSTNHQTLRRGPIAGGDPFEVGNARYNELIREVAASAEVTLCEISQAFAPFDEEELGRMLLPPPDVLHLSAEGNEVYADAIWPPISDAVASALHDEGVLN